MDPSILKIIIISKRLRDGEPNAQEAAVVLARQRLFAIAIVIREIADSAVIPSGQRVPVVSFFFHCCALSLPSFRIPRRRLD